MFLCLCQWLETNPSTDGLQNLATNLKNASVKFVENFDITDPATKPHLNHVLKRFVFAEIL